MATSSEQGRRPYATDLTDAQWNLIEPILPPPNLDGRHEKHPRREIVNAIFYLLRTGCAWRLLPHDLPPWQTVYRYFRRWSDDGTVERIHNVLRDRLRDTADRDPAASAGIIDAQSVKGADTVGAETRGYDAGKRINGRKRHIVVDTLGLLLLVSVTTAGLQDRAAAHRVLEQLRFVMASVVIVFADGGYAGKLVEFARRRLRLAVEIVAKPPEQQGFAVLPRRWVVERTFGWLMRCRRLCRDYERLPTTSKAFITWAMIGLMTRRIAPTPGRQPWQPQQATQPI
jgi:transposase